MSVEEVDMRTPQPREKNEGGEEFTTERRRFILGTIMQCPIAEIQKEGSETSVKLCLKCCLPSISRKSVPYELQLLNHLVFSSSSSNALTHLLI